MDMHEATNIYSLEEEISIYNKIAEKYPEYVQDYTHPLELREEIVSKQETQYSKCKFCSEISAYSISAQLRSADEGETLINICTKCNKKW